MGSLGRLKLCLIYPCFSKCQALPLAHSFIQYIVYTRHGYGNGQRKSRRSRDWQVNKELPTAISGDLKGKAPGIAEHGETSNPGRGVSQSKEEGERQHTEEGTRVWASLACCRPHSQVPG